MSVTPFDTRAFVERLTAVGMPEAQAEVLADQQAQLIDERLATKSDIAALATRIDACATRAELRETELRLEAKIETTKSEIVKWIFGQGLVLIGVMMALLRFGH